MIGIKAKQFNFKVYYCQPYSSFQKALTKHKWVVRRWYKKGTDFSLVSKIKLKLLNEKQIIFQEKCLVIKQLIKCTKKIFKTKNPKLGH